MSIKSFAVAAICFASATCALASTTTSLHKVHTPDTRISLTLVNKADQFRDVTIQGHTYTMGAHELLRIKAPAGTVVYAASTALKFHRGDVVVSLQPSLNDTTISLN